MHYEQQKHRIQQNITEVNRKTTHKHIHTHTQQMKYFTILFNSPFLSVLMLNSIVVFSCTLNFSVFQIRKCFRMKDRIFSLRSVKIYGFPQLTYTHTERKMHITFRTIQHTKCTMCVEIFHIM